MVVFIVLGPQRQCAFFAVNRRCDQNSLPFVIQTKHAMDIITHLPSDQAPRSFFSTRHVVVWEANFGDDGDEEGTTLLSLAIILAAISRFSKTHKVQTNCLWFSGAVRRFLVGSPVYPPPVVDNGLGSTSSQVLKP
jgi:hypothetical protein